MEIRVHCSDNMMQRTDFLLHKEPVFFLLFANLPEWFWISIVFR